MWQLLRTHFVKNLHYLPPSDLLQLHLGEFTR